MLVVPEEFNRNSPTVTSLMTPEQSGLWLLERMRRQIGFESYKNIKVLDFGCGVRFTQAIINTDLPFGRYVGVDVSRPMIEFLRENVRDARFDYHFLDAYHPMYNPIGKPLTIESTLPIKDRDFDVACMFSVITHQYPDYSKSIFSMLRRQVSDRGHLFFTCFLDDAIDTFEDRSPQQDGGRCFYNSQFLKELVESCGWRQIDRTPSIGPLIGNSFLFRAASQPMVQVITASEMPGYQSERRSISTTPVCIAGMHRSGTSMVTSVLRDCGLFLGPEEELAGEASDNTEGFWENQNFVALNDDILRRFGGRWDEPPNFPDHWESDELVQPLLQTASELVQAFSGHETWGWKDPRNSLTIPFWRRTVPTLRFVICVRNPLEVAHSLFVRGDATGASQFELWLHYYQQILAATSEPARIVTHYQSYFEDAPVEVLRLANWVGLEISDETFQRVETRVSVPLRHHHATTDDLRKAGASDEVLDLYLRLCEEAGPICRQFLERESRSRAPANQPPEETALQVMRFENQLTKKEERLRLAEQQNASLQAQLHRLSTVLRELQHNNEVRLLNNEARLHEVHASLLPLMRTLDKLRGVRNQLRSLIQRR